MKTFASLLQPLSLADADPAGHPTSSNAASQLPAQTTTQPPIASLLVSPNRYVAPKSGVRVPSLLTPESLRQADRIRQPSKSFHVEKTELLLQMQKLQAVPRRPNRAVRSLDFEQFRTKAEEVDGYGEMHAIAAGSPALYRRLSASLLNNAQAVEIQKYAAGHLNTQAAKKDLQAFSKAIVDMQGPGGLTANVCWSYLQGMVQSDGQISSRNHLLTVANFSGLGQLQIYSVSGGLGNGTQREKQHTSIHVKGGRPDGQILRCVSLPRLGNAKQCAAEASGPHMKHALASPNAVLYVGYDTLVIGRGNNQQEARVLPRTFSNRENGGVQDRARDTEFVVLSALRMWLKANPAWQSVPLDLLMFSRLPMCSSCENAASHALLRPEFRSVTAFRVYNAPSGSR